MWGIIRDYMKVNLFPFFFYQSYNIFGEVYLKEVVFPKVIEMILHG